MPARHREPASDWWILLTKRCQVEGAPRFGAAHRKHLARHLSASRSSWFLRNNFPVDFAKHGACPKSPLRSSAPRTISPSPKPFPCLAVSLEEGICKNSNSFPKAAAVSERTLSWIFVPQFLAKTIWQKSDDSSQANRPSMWCSTRWRVSRNFTCGVSPTLKAAVINKGGRLKQPPPF